MISLANTAEPLYLVNRSGNRPSHEQAAEYLDKAIELCRRAGFRRITVRGDTDFTQTKHLDRWNCAGDINFVFGFDNNEALKARADELPPESYSFLERPPRYEIKTAPASNPNDSSSRSSTSGATRRSTCSKRRSPSSTIAQSPVTGVIG